MKRLPGFLLLVATLALPLLTGCFASVDVTKVPVGEATSTQPSVSGIRYSLPAAFLVVEPDPAKAGSYTVETKLFPDTTQTYAIASTAYLSTATLNVELSEGLLTKVTINQNTGDIGEEALKGISEVVKTDLEQRKQEKEAAETARKEAAKELETLEAAVKKAEDDLVIARRSVAEWELLVSNAPDNQTYKLGLLQAKNELAKAEIALQRANQALAERQAQTSGGSSGGAQDSPGNSGDGAPEGGNPTAAPPQPPPTGDPAAPGTPANPGTTSSTSSGAAVSKGGGDTNSAKKDTAPAHPTRKGPVVYRLVDTCDVWSEDKVFKNCKVELVPVPWNLQGKNQLDLPVRAIASKPAEPKQPELVDVQITPEPVIFSKGVFKKGLVLSVPVCSIDKSKSTLKTVDLSTGEEGDPLPLDTVGLTLQTGKANIELVVRERALAAATYYLTLQMLYGDCAPGKSKSAPVAYQFRIGS